MSRPRLYLHIGAPKTGTTYLQTVLDAASADLARAGLLFPGGKGDQQQATRDLLAVGTARARLNRAGAWPAMVEQIRTWPQTVVFSNETLAIGLRPQRIPRLLDRLDSHEVHVVYTARDLVRQLPAAWQEALKNRDSTRFDEFTSRLASGEQLRRSVPGERIWLALDAVSVLDPWAQQIGRDRVHVVTVPTRGSDPRTLLDRIGRVVGLDLAAFDGGNAKPNVSLDVAEAALLRHLNRHFADSGEGLPWPRYVTLVKRFLANEALPRRSERRPLWLTPKQLEWASEQSRLLAEAIAEAQFDVVGDLSDLTPATPGVPVSVDDVDYVGETQLSDVAVFALAETLREWD